MNCSLQELRDIALCNRLVLPAEFIGMNPNSLIPINRMRVGTSRAYVPPDGMSVEDDIPIVEYCPVKRSSYIW